MLEVRLTLEKHTSSTHHFAGNSIGEFLPRKPGELCEDSHHLYKQICVQLYNLHKCTNVCTNVQLLFIFYNFTILQMCIICTIQNQNQNVPGFIVGFVYFVIHEDLIPSNCIIFGATVIDDFCLRQDFREACTAR